MFELVNADSQTAVIKVIGVGGGGGNAVKHMLGANVDGVEFICANTDIQALGNSAAYTALQLGDGITKGLGAGADPEVGRRAALEDRDKITDALHGADMVFITAGMGGGTGTGAAPVVAQAAKDMGILTVAVVTTPFVFEGKKRARAAVEGARELCQYVDSLITIPNAKLSSVLGEDVTQEAAFAAVDNVLLGAVQGIADLIIKPGLINVDFADVKAVMGEMGMALMGFGKAQGEDRARVAAEAAVSNPLLEGVGLEGARGLLVNITAGRDLSMKEFEEVGAIVTEPISEDATVIVGAVVDADLGGEVWVTIVATGLGGKEEPPKPAVALVGPAANQDYANLDRPTVLRYQQERNGRRTAAGDDIDYDYPAFLRRQAD